MPHSQELGTSNSSNILSCIRGVCQGLYLGVFPHAGNVILFPSSDDDVSGRVRCRERLGGLVRNR